MSSANAGALFEETFEKKMEFVFLNTVITFFFNNTVQTDQAVCFLELLLFTLDGLGWSPCRRVYTVPV